jgi:hypothetical protein
LEVALGKEPIHEGEELGFVGDVVVGRYDPEYGLWVVVVEVRSGPEDAGGGIALKGF